MDQVRWQKSTYSLVNAIEKDEALLIRRSKLYLESELFSWRGYFDRRLTALRLLPEVAQLYRDAWVEILLEIPTARAGPV
jgi:hypothetical protein